MSGTLKISGTTLATNPTNSKVEIDDAVSGKGIAKAWIRFNGFNVPANADSTNTIGIVDSFNVTGLEDEGTGDFIIHFANNVINNANYSIQGTATGDNSANQVSLYPAIVQVKYENVATTSSVRISVVRWFSGSGAFGVFDSTLISVAIFGS
tara:strand:- start:142 stop:597 length:456 start_codon:yes stop_codon:yes gene_type:complete